MARIVDRMGRAIRPADVAAIKYSIGRVMPRPRGKECVALRHRAVELNVRDVLFDRLISGGRWTLDPFGYNFRHEMEFSADEAAAMPDGRFEVRYALTATTGEVTNLRFQGGTGC